LWPILVKIGPVPINTFGVVLVLAFLLGTWYITRDGARQGLDPEKIQSLCWVVLGAIVIGGRLMFIITEPGYYAKDPLRVFYIWEGGLVYYGGFLATVGTVVYFAWKNKLPIYKLTDLFTVGGMLGLALGRFGCFVAGDDHGRVIPGATDDSHPFWAVKFARDVPYLGIGDPAPAPHITHPAMDLNWADKWLYPSQFMMMLNAFLLFLILRYVSQRKKFDGQLTALLLMLYAVGRSIIEVYRGDVDRGVYFASETAVKAYSLGIGPNPGFYLTTSQLLSIVLFVLGAALYVARRNSGVAPVPKHAQPEAGAEGAAPVSSPKARLDARQQKRRGKKR
jgi:phosphatidylglycerol---prolipoprotein diacylglyceryl transferase